MPRPVPHWLCMVLLVPFTFACAKHAPSTNPMAGQPASPTAPVAEEPPPRAAASTEQGPATDSLSSRLAYEASRRPQVTPSVEQVLAALEKAGAVLARKQQSLGETYKADYCLGGYTVEGSLALSVCEYGDAAAAQAGRDLSKQILARVASRDVWAHKADTLSIIQLKDDDATATRKKRLVETFLSL